MIEFRLLGTLHLIDAAGREVKSLLTRPRRLALLAYLAAATPRGLHRRDSLLALFWPELDQEHARAALRQALHVVRDALGADVIVTRGDERSEEHTSELQSPCNLVCRLLLEKKKKNTNKKNTPLKVKNHHTEVVTSSTLSI